MSVSALVGAIRTSVIDENLKIYSDLFNETDRAEAADRYWSDALAFFDSLSEADRDMLFRIIRQVSIDAVSNVLGVLDGSSFAEGVDGEIVVQISPSGDVISGDLQDAFVSLFESE